MKVLITVPSYHPSIFGGIAICMHQIIPEVAKKCQVTVLTTSFKIPDNSNIEYDKWMSKDGHEIMYVKTEHTLLSTKYIITAINQVKRCDRVYLNSLFFFPNLLVYLFAKIYKKKVFWSTHGELGEPALKIKKFKKKIYLFALKTNSAKIHFISTSDQEAIQIRNKFKLNRISVIPNFFDIIKLEDFPKKNQFLFLGRISPIKKIENLIIAFSKSIALTEPGASDYKLIIAGEYDNEYVQYFECLKALIQSLSMNDRISFIGSVSSPQKEVLIAESKALCLVSSSENFGNVVVEALAQGTPVIASHGTPWADLNETNSGFWIENSP
jgi:glycosyltransferase involved in cell wall biosynthesis